MLNFDLNQNPPTAEEIAAERQEIDRRISVFKRKAWVISVALIVAVASFFVACWSSGNELAGADAGAAVGAFTFFVVGVAASAIKDRCNGYKSRLSSLDDIDPSDCDRLIKDCLAAPECEAYRQKVAALGRKLVKAETKMIREAVVREWALAAGREKERLAAEKERREGIACALVSSKEPLRSEMDMVTKGEPSC